MYQLASDTIHDRYHMKLKEHNLLPPVIPTLAKKRNLLKGPLGPF
jgi:hypothetical protein